MGNLKDSMEHYLQDAAEPDFVEVPALPRLCLVGFWRKPDVLDLDVAMSHSFLMLCNPKKRQ